MLTKSATELAAAIRAGDATSVQVVQAHYDHLDKVNPGLNAVVFQRREAAFAEAQAADAQRAAAAR